MSRTICRLSEKAGRKVVKKVRISLLKKLALVLFGFVVGAGAMAYAAMRASAMFLEVARTNYILEQQVRAACAEQSGNWAEAVHRYANAAEAASASGARFVTRMTMAWNLTFPMESGVLEKVVAEGGGRKGRSMQEGTMRAMLAEALENLGSQEEADRELRIASQMLGYGENIDAVRSLAELVHVSNQDLRLLKESVGFSGSCGESPKSSGE
jgi:hypothetical protein